MTKNNGPARNAILALADLGLLSLVRVFTDVRLNGLAVSQHLYFDVVAYFAAAQGVGEIV